MADGRLGCSPPRKHAQKKSHRIGRNGNDTDSNAKARSVVSPGPERLARAVPIALGLEGSPGEHGGDPTPAGGASKTMINLYQRSSFPGSAQRLLGGTGCSLQPLQDEGLQDALLFIFSKETPPATLHYSEKNNIFYFFYLK